MLVEALTVFLGAFLLFQIQPLIGKYILPWFGGSPAVWSTCLLFFQVALLAGYFYAHRIVQRLSPRAARAVHMTLIVVSLAVLTMLAIAWKSPILPGASWKPADPSRPVERILILLATAIGLPYLLLSSTSPLVQAWAAQAHPGARVYRLYALSNLGSLLALVSYPPIVERLLPLRVQAWVWTATYVVFALGSIVCAWRASATDRSDEAGALAERTSSAESLPHLFWFALAACGSMMLLATTNQMCQEVAAIPFLWILPLCLYLLSFVFCFESDRFYKRFLFGPALAASLGWAAYVLWRGFQVSIRTQVAAYCAALFAACMVLHGELARAKPKPTRLTSFYLTIAAGGAAGGIFVALIAPAIFRAFWEIHLALLLSAAMAIVALARDRSSWLHRFRPWPAFLVLLAAAALIRAIRDPQSFNWATWRETLRSGSGLLGLAVAIAVLVILLWLKLLVTRGRPWFAGACLIGAWMCLGFLLWSEIGAFLESAVSVSRNFYGVLTVEKVHADDPDLERLDLRNGRIVHGFQYQNPDKRYLPTTYYTKGSGIGLALLDGPQRASGPMKIGVVGLGTGTIAVYGRPGDTFRFYDINPGVVALSRGPKKLFTYLADSPAQIDLVMGDARLSLERELVRDPQRFDVLAIDAFTSDAIPVHLLTREAVRVYLGHLAPQGILAVHISNRQLDLEPVVRALARSLDLSMCVVDKAGDGDAIWGTTWVLLSPNGQVLEIPAIADACARGRDGSTARLWTDDYSNLFEALK